MYCTGGMTVVYRFQCYGERTQQAADCKFNAAGKYEERRNTGSLWQLQRRPIRRPYASLWSRLANNRFGTGYFLQVWINV